MNKELKDRIFEVPIDILKQINHTIAGLNGVHAYGIDRAKTILNDKTVTYGQLKRIIHDINNMDKVRDKIKYDLCGGQLMETWANQFLTGERDLIKNRKETKKKSNEISSMTGERKNAYLKKHTKNFDFSIPTNMMKSNSHKTSISPIIDLKLFEDIQKIKKLIDY